jgi:hypothetical protein
LIVDGEPINLVARYFDLNERYRKSLAKGVAIESQQIESKNKGGRPRRLPEPQLSIETIAVAGSRCPWLVKQSLDIETRQ